MINHWQTGDSKRSRRRQARQQQAGLDPRQVERDGSAILLHLQASPLWSRTRVLHSYVDSLAGEVVTRGAIEAARAAGMRVIVPYVEAQGSPMRHAEIDGLRDLQSGHWGLLQPTQPRFIEELTIIDLILVPGLLFDRRGFRIGQVGGYYDRFLARATGATTIGLTYDESVIDRIPDEAHDIPVQWLATPSGVHPTEGNQ